MKELRTGANTPLENQQKSTITVKWVPQKVNGCDVDVSAFLLKADGKVRSDEDFIFYNQPTTPDGAVELIAGESPVFHIITAKLPAEIEKVAIVVTIHGNANFSSLSLVELQVDNAVRFAPPVQGMSERALLLGEIYKRNNSWKFRAIGQGFSEGLGPLATNFGVDVGSDPVESPQKAPPPPPKPVNLSKITLEKKGQSVSLEKRDHGFGEVRVNLNWSQAQGKPKGFFSRKSKEIDLDLGCFVETRDGFRGVVQAVGNQFGSLDRPPYIVLKGDDRSGTSTEGEDLVINGSKWKEIRRILIFTFIYDGVANWDATDGIVTLYVQGEPPLEVRLTHGEKNKGMCAIAEIVNEDNKLKVIKRVDYFNGHPAMDKHFGWGFSWRAGSK